MSAKTLMNTGSLNFTLEQVNKIHQNLRMNEFKENSESLIHCQLQVSEITMISRVVLCQIKLRGIISPRDSPRSMKNNIDHFCFSLIQRGPTLLATTRSVGANAHFPRSFPLVVWYGITLFPSNTIRDISTTL